MYAKSKKEFLVGPYRNVAVEKGEIREIIDGISSEGKFCVRGRDNKGVFGYTDLQDWEIAKTKKELQNKP